MGKITSAKKGRIKPALTAAAQTAQLFNLSELASPFRLSRPTIGDYVTLLEQVFLIQRLPSWHSNRLSRLVKAPKLHVGDTGVACAVLNHSAAALCEDRPLLGHLLETWVVQELRRQASWSAERIQLHHFRTKEGAEVDAVLERAGRQDRLGSQSFSAQESRAEMLTEALGPGGAGAVL